MKSLQNYLKEYGKYTLLEKEFNEVDNIMLSIISYVDYKGIVPGIKLGKISLKEASNRYFKMNTKKEVDRDIRSVRNAKYLLKAMAETRRFKDLILYNYKYKVTEDMQFGALCIQLPDKKIYVSFKGTDSYVSGWEEDCMFTYMFPTKAQEEAIKYLNKVIGLLSPKIYVGGHSKGGNLAIVASMYARPIIRHKIISIFNNDGPGLRKKEFESREYKKIESKLITYVPKYCLVGMLLRHSDKYIVVDSENKKFLQHDATSWIVEVDKLKRTELSEFSKKVEKGAIAWLEKLEDQKRKHFVESLFSILKKAEITDLNEIIESKVSSILKIIKGTNDLDKETRDMLITGFKDLYNEIKKEQV